MLLDYPDKKYFESFMEAVAEFSNSGPTEHHPTSEEISNRADFLNYIQNMEDRRLGRNLKPGYVPDTYLWMIADSKYCGQISISHRLIPALEQFGGHIGYAVRPSERRKGYATKALELALPYARELGLRKVLITCYKSNIASAKIIIANGGVLQDEIQNEGHHDLTQRYWITYRI